MADEKGKRVRIDEGYRPMPVRPVHDPRKVEGGYQGPKEHTSESKPPSGVSGVPPKKK
jgi:hypothetical protein